MRRLLAFGLMMVTAGCTGATAVVESTVTTTVTIAAAGTTTTGPTPRTLTVAFPAGGSPCLPDLAMVERTIDADTPVADASLGLLLEAYQIIDAPEAVPEGQQ